MLINVFLHISVFSQPKCMKVKLLGLLGFEHVSFMQITQQKKNVNDINKWYQCESLNHVQLFSTAWTIARQAPLSI